MTMTASHVKCLLLVRNKEEKHVFFIDDRFREDKEWMKNSLTIRSVEIDRCSNEVVCETKTIKDINVFYRFRNMRTTFSRAF